MTSFAKFTLFAALALCCAASNILSASAQSVESQREEVSLRSSQPFYNEHLSLFSMNEREYRNLDLFPKWTRILSQLSAFNAKSTKEWSSFVASRRNSSFWDKLTLANNWGNEHPYVQDITNWGTDDYWETPDEFIAASGDCEDYAIAKYYLLRFLGIPAEKMRIIIVQDLNLGGIIHAVLGVYDDNSNMMVLDNQNKYIVPALKIFHYRPIYGINEFGWWAYYPKI